MTKELIATSLKMWSNLPNLLIFLLVLTSSSAASPKFDFHTSYDRHCGSILPQATLKGFVLRPPYQQSHTGYYTGAGSGILSPDPSYQVQNSLDFYTYSIRETNTQGLFNLQGSLRFVSVNSFQFLGNSTSGSRGSMRFSLEGFWSPSSGKVCMVGSGLGYAKRKGYLHRIHPVLELNNFVNSTSVSTLISGTLQSLNEDDPSDSGEPVSMLMFPSINNYQYTLVSNQSENISSGASDDLNSTSSLKIERFCSVLSRVLNNDFDLKYSSRCDSAKNCTPLAVSAGLPGIVSMKYVDCSDDTRRLRVLVEFSNRKAWYRRPFNPNTTLVGEGMWQAKKNQLSIVACRFLDAAGSWDDAHVGDCSTRLSLRFPAAWSIGDTSSFVGQIWSSKNVTESGYFEKITFRSSEDDIGRVLMPGLKYEYTKTDQVTKLCPRKKIAHSKKNIYPEPFSYDMRFDVSAKTSKGKKAWGSCAPLSVGDKFYQPQWYYSTRDESLFSRSGMYYSAPASLPVVLSYNQSSPCNISYTINIQMLSSSKNAISVVDDMQISAEGIYDARDGSLCMVGCRKLGSKSQQPTNESVDCEIVVHFQFPPTNPSTNSSRIKGSMKSTRNKSDQLHFESWEFSSASVYLIQERRSIWRMDVEITLVLISTTLACVFGALQLFHVKKNPDAVPSISILMLLILSLGYMIPLMLNFEAMFTNSPHRQNVFLGSGGWLEVNEVIVRVTTMAAFLLQIRLLQLTWSARSASGTEKELWMVEKKALFVALPAYAAGAFVAFLLHRQVWSKSHSYGTVISYPKHSILGTSLISYAGLVFDGFLLPQILLNMFYNSKAKALSVSFYVGTTFIRVLPHAYDLYRAHHSAQNQLNGSYFYASPAADFYSTAWDVIIPFGGLLFAGVIYLQQKFGGLWILPQKFRNWGAYEKVPTVTEG